jgi:hypothetical protein
VIRAFCQGIFRRNSWLRNAVKHTFAADTAAAKAEAEFPDLDDYVLYSVHPRAFKGDPSGLHWEFVWKAKAFPHHKQSLFGFT